MEIISLNTTYALSTFWFVAALSTKSQSLIIKSRNNYRKYNWVICGILLIYYLKIFCFIFFMLIASIVESAEPVLKIHKHWGDRSCSLQLVLPPACLSGLCLSFLCYPPLWLSVLVFRGKNFNSCSSKRDLFSLILCLH